MFLTHTHPGRPPVERNGRGGSAADREAGGTRQRVVRRFDHVERNQGRRKEEAATIWKIYGVDLQFAKPNADAALSLDVFVERTPPSRKHTGEPTVLGRTTIASALASQAPLRISFDAVTALLDSQHGVNPLLHDYAIAAALGRVVAHEIGHVLLGMPAYHDTDGLMRTTFFPDDLARPERSRFLLTHRSVARLRSRIAVITEAQSPGEDCEQ